MPPMSRSVFLLAVLLAACTQLSPPSIEPSAAPRVEPSATASARLVAQPQVAGLPFGDPRLNSVWDELRRHPEWLDEPLAAHPTVLALVPGTSAVCLAIEGSAGDVFVTIDPADPWSVSAVGLDRGEMGRRYTVDSDDMTDECTFVVFGRRDPWPADHGDIEVSGNADPLLSRAVAEAVHARPERFGIDRQGIPAVVVGDRIEPAPDGWTCLQAIVFVGGPRSRVIIGIRRSESAVWHVEARIVERALLAPEPRLDGRC